MFWQCTKPKPDFQIDALLPRESIPPLGHENGGNESGTPSPKTGEVMPGPKCNDAALHFRPGIIADPGGGAGVGGAKGTGAGEEEGLAPRVVSD